MWRCRKLMISRILGIRALQISMTAPVMVELEGETDPLEIAMKELRQRKIPCTIRRYLADPHAVNLLWDIENSRVERNQTLAVFDNVEASLQLLDRRYRLSDTHLLVGNLNLPFIQPYQHQLANEMHCILVDAPHRYRYCAAPACPNIVQPSSNPSLPFERPYDVAERIMLQQVKRLVLEDRLADNVLLASTDSDYSSTVRMLQRNGYTVFIAALSTAKVGYVGLSNNSWLWDRMSVAPTPESKLTLEYETCKEARPPDQT
ncbi:unnamed protein product [Microthlaspi erraticum]|uniref:NYN domain-containing protein n=1 Tax=Microthlaspi erraticum TaxID=1685480 RepID=A0A6D2J2A3_9BRAS|nr:unnamed protein product [Microthlaspi erraticum]